MLVSILRVGIPKNRASYYGDGGGWDEGSRQGGGTVMSDDIDAGYSYNFQSQFLVIWL
jgi:hypothetical protein